MPAAEFTVTCLCAEWCGVCREYRPGFEALAARFPQAAFIWLDVEDNAEEVAEREIENFPTIEIRRGQENLFYGVLLPRPEILERLLKSIL